MADNGARRHWTTTMEDAADGSGDAIVVIPDDLLEQMGWSEGTELSVRMLGDGSIELSEAS